MISYIWAEDANGIIGANGSLPWHLPDDMAYFKSTTMGNPIISGANTFRSYNRPLPGRQNIVVSRQNNFPDGIIAVSSIESLCDLINQAPDKNYFVTGGATIFTQLLDKVDYLYRTKINHSFNGDTYMPKIDYNKFRLIRSQPGVVDEKNKYQHTFEVYERIGQSPK
ncbi:dihydrofolate reductase [Lentilactobacillus kisonensis]|uniref:Dihydrofolate reductase n=2 Tax=Lentilactobacillus kisonensis TaxID=481722 RepID=H1LG50_9LACO|nr:dihydrofolate reductase [Lentilactobacillus kisonensis]EHO51062.1 dihydrofolate reductase [Lentilactobacillus kisonensis F0435]KRL23380.1 dihydrofolate reductase [Lentilactobacillus kisonensis DSM 19906 = JCM 15041]